VTLFRKTLRTRLTLLYVSLLCVVLVLYAASTSIFLWRGLLREMDLSLDRDLETVENLIAISPDGSITVNTGDQEAVLLLEIWSSSGTLIYQSGDLKGQMLGPPVKKDDPSHPANRSVPLASKMRVRVMTRPHKLGNQTVVVRLGVSENALREEFGRMVGALSLGLPIALLLLGVTGYFVALRALRPLDSMARRAKQINAEHLNERLGFENPDDELGHLAMAFNETLARLEHSFEQLKQFTADASHELRTPLTAMRSVGEVALQNGGDTRYHHDVIGSMLEEVNRLTHLVDSLLIFARADSGHLPLQRSEVGLLELATESAVLLEVLAEEKKQSVEIEGDESLTVIADRLILRQALVAIIHNAVKYSPLQGSIRVRVGAENGDAFVEIQDSGPGIPPEHRAKVFERFYRVDKARTRTEGGSGLGLSIADWSIRAHGGQIDLECYEQLGCTFRIRLPQNGSRSPSS
jgi:heavy metal sensor kinase